MIENMQDFNPTYNSLVSRGFQYTYFLQYVQLYKYGRLSYLFMLESKEYLFWFQSSVKLPCPGEEGLGSCNQTLDEDHHP